MPEVLLDMLLAEYAISEGREGALEAVGFRVGYAMVERLIAKQHAGQAAQQQQQRTPAWRPADQLDAVKWVCKDFWTLCFGKTVDHLRTNHRGVFVLHDTNFRPLRHVAARAKETTAARLRIPAGIVEGALAALGTTASQVNAECAAAPDVTFTVKINAAAPPAPAK